MIKKCAPGLTLAPGAVAVRQHAAFRASAHPQRSVFFYTIGNSISYRIKKGLSRKHIPTALSQARDSPDVISAEADFGVKKAAA